MYIKARFIQTYLKPCLVPDGAVVKSSRGGEEKHDGDQGVEHNRQDQWYQIEEGDVHEEHCNVHFRGT